MFVLAALFYTSTSNAAVDSCTTAIDSAAFDGIKTNIVQQDFDDAKVTIIANLVKTTCFSCKQVKSLMALFSFEEDKITIAKLTFARVADPQNFDIIYTVFEFDSSKDEIRQHIDGLLKTN